MTILPGIGIGLQAAAGSHGVASLVHPAAASVFQNISSYTVTAASISTATPSRIVVALIASYDSGNSILNSVTIGGVTATLIKASTTIRNAGIAYAIVPTGTTADVVVTLASTTENSLCDIFVVYGCESVFASATATRTTSGTTLSASGLNAPPDAIALSCIEVGNDAVVSWTANVTKYADREINTTFNERFSTAAKLQTSAMVADTITCTTGTATNGAIAAAVFY